MWNPKTSTGSLHNMKPKACRLSSRRPIETLQDDGDVLEASASSPGKTSPSVKSRVDIRRTNVLWEV